MPAASGIVQAIPVDESKKTVFSLEEHKKRTLLYAVAAFSLFVIVFALPGLILLAGIILGFVAAAATIFACASAAIAEKNNNVRLLYAAAAVSLILGMVFVPEVFMVIGIVGGFVGAFYGIYHCVLKAMEHGKAWKAAEKDMPPAYTATAVPSNAPGQTAESNPYIAPSMTAVPSSQATAAAPPPSSPPPPFSSASFGNTKKTASAPVSPTFNSAASFGQ
ncbi:MAG: hypothetical protein Q8R79_07320 [Legionellaceae bacterium]|nr:hypothetical protein [Legionellaceae bacterium]